MELGEKIHPAPAGGAAPGNPRATTSFLRDHGARRQPRHGHQGGGRPGGHVLDGAFPDPPVDGATTRLVLLGAPYRLILVKNWLAIMTAEEKCHPILF